MWLSPGKDAEKLGVDVIAQLRASVLKAHGRQDDAVMEFAALAVGDPNAGAVPEGGVYGCHGVRAGRRHTR